ncbi:EF hand family protein [Babesia bovis T2Bo]|uniref:Membrane protein, putative n=1 Tax=Babesia bovis TaxID=5865 RepID=A7AN85_BABBO|nr:EF hand family protein [Babesia bovis T2Bo]EDO08019.1 EF hand family protein [Babesia bovis T2Bo]|eukprot:XP_001611587.1 membrane protein [Babesia bovis T2Bo]
MDFHVASSIKTFVTCMSALPFTYIAVFIVTWLGNLDGIELSQRLKAELCNRFLPNDWKYSVWSCYDIRDNHIDMDDFESVSLFSNAQEDFATLVKTSKLENGVKVEKENKLIYATRELINVCTKWNVDKEVYRISPVIATTILDKLCPMLNVHIQHINEDESTPWSNVYTVLANMDSHHEMDIANVVSQCDVITNDSVNRIRHNASGNYFKHVVSPVLEYMKLYVKDDAFLQIVTSDELLAKAAPMAHVMEIALPAHISTSPERSTDSLLRLFSSFPEAASMFAFALEHNLVQYPTINADTQDEAMAQWSVFIASLQVMVTTMFDKLASFSQIASIKGMNMNLDSPLDGYWDKFAKDGPSKAYLANLFDRISKTKVHPEYYATMAYSVNIADKVTSYLFANNAVNVDTTLSRRRLAETVIFHLIQMCKFALADKDKTGQVSLYEFAGTVVNNVDPEQLKQQVQQILEKQGKIMVQYDLDFINWRAKVVKRQYRKALEEISGKYNEVLDTFMIIDADGSGDLSLQEFFQHAYITAPLTMLDIRA